MQNYFNSVTGTGYSNYLTDNSTSSYVSIQAQQYVTLGFTNEGITNSSGADIRIFEVGAADEKAEVSVSLDGGVTFISLGIFDGDAASFDIDLSDYGFSEGTTINAIKIEAQDNGGSAPGFDLGAVVDINSGKIANVLIDTNIASDEFQGDSGDSGPGEIPNLSNIVDGNTSTYASIPLGASVSVGIDPNGSFAGIYDGEGNDLFIREFGRGGSTEDAEVYVSTDGGRTFTYLGKAEGNGNVTAFDLNTIGITGIVNAVRLVGLSNAGGSPGFDLVKIYGDTDSLVGQIMGTTASDIFSGTTNSDQLEGLEGNDILNGGDGDDLLIGGSGSDQLNGGDGIDTASYADSDSGVVVFTNGKAGRKGDAQGDSLNSIENIIGSGFNDQIVLNSNSGTKNTVFAGDGDDLIKDRDGGDDTFYGEDGDDVIIGFKGNDTIDAGDGINTVSGGTGNDTIFGNSGADLIFGNKGKDIIKDGSSNDILSGATGNDIIFGDRGDDILAGGEGNDILFGGKNSNLFVFGLGDDNDQISDFQTAQDTIDLREFGFTDFSEVQSLMNQTDQDGNTAVSITFNAEDILQINNVQISDLEADHFILF